MKIKRETWIMIALLLVVIISCMFMGSNIYEGAVTMVSAQKNSAMRVTYANQFNLINDSMKRVRTGLDALKPKLIDASGIPMPVDPSNVQIANAFNQLKMDAGAVVSKIEQLRNMAYPVPVNIQPAPPNTDTSYNKTDASYNYALPKTK